MPHPLHLRTTAALALAALAMGAASTQAYASPPAPATKPLTLTLPTPSGPAAVGTVELHLVDPGRTDALRPARQRELMVSLWYPAQPTPGLRTAPQMPPAAARDFDRHTASDLGIAPGQVDWSATQTTALVDAPVAATPDDLPVIVYSPGLDGPRTLGTALVSDLASRGYLVVTIDHTYEPDQVAFPGGRVERGRMPKLHTERAFARLLRTLLRERSQDVRFVLDQLGRINAGTNPDAEGTPLPAGIAGSVDLDHVGMFGHSFGGATAAELTRTEPRIDAGANLDGRLVGAAPRLGVRKPFLQLAGETTTHRTEPSWDAFWQHSTGWKREVRLRGSQHLSFMDLQAMLPPAAAKLPGLPLKELVGTIDPERSINAQRRYLAAFFGLHLKGLATTVF